MKSYFFALCFAASLRASYIPLQTGQNVGIGSAAVPDALLTLNPNSTPTAAAPPGGLEHVVGANGASAGVTIDTYGNGSSVSPFAVMRNANGTAAVPTASANTNSLGALEAEGYIGSAFAVGAAVVATATQNWTGSAMGTSLNFEVVKNGTTSLASALLLDNDGQAYMPGLVNVTSPNTGTVCWTTTTGRLTYDASSTCLVSSRRFKHAIRPSPGLSLLERLRPVSYLYNGTNAPHYGLIAEEVQKINPRLVAVDENNLPSAVKLLDLIAVLIKGVQQQQVEIKALRKRISN